MKILLAIGVGSFVGGVCRYLLSKIISFQINSEFPFGTFIVNVLGCFAIGLVFGLFVRGQVSENWKVVLATGVIGGFTTFSAFSIEAINLFRQGNMLFALTYITSSVMIGLIATFIGYQIVT